MSAPAAFALTDSAPDTLAVSGAFTFATAAAALAACRERLRQLRADATLDLAGVAHADSAGLAVLLALVGDARRRGGMLRIANVPDSLRALAQLADVDTLLGFA